MFAKAGFIFIVRKRVAVALAATTSLTMAFTMTATPTYAQAAEVSPTLEQGDASSALTAAKQTGIEVKM